MSKSRLDLANQPGYAYEPYHSTAKRAPIKPLVFLPHTLTERTGPVFGDMPISATDEDGKYRFLTIKPGAYPWNNHPNAWRPAHIHFSLFGPSFVSRFMTQMYFEGDPMLAYDPVFQAIPDRAKHRVLAGFDINLTEEKWALGYRFDMVLRGPDATPAQE